MNFKRFALFLICISVSAAQIIAQEATRLGGAKIIAQSSFTGLPNFIKPKGEIRNENFITWATYALNLPQNSTLKPYSIEKDELGFTHMRHKQYVNGFPVEGSMVITHSESGTIRSVNGDYFQNFNSSLTPTLTEPGALQYALNKVNAKRYMWENLAFTAQKRINNPDFTFFPKGELVVVHKKDADYSASNMRLAYKFNIYAEEPLYRANVFVDANTGEILDEQNLICTINVVGTAATVYSGTVTMTSDSVSASVYRLRETGRGNGIRTFNLQHGTNYQNVDFTNTSAAWTTVGPDQAATDAHWGAEMTYDYYKQVHNRNSIDANGFALLSYVHYSNNYANAFWNGQEMTYGDGGSGFKIMTGLDVCGHEITHGLTNFTAGLGGGEAGALNEGFSDIFGTTIEKFARPLQNDWVMGAEITNTGLGIRNMANPKSLGQPNCYLGTNWDATLEPHQDNGPCIYWYYLLCQGGSGVNDFGNAWSVTGLTITKAQMIAFRALTVYFTPSTNYAMARTYSIHAAEDLYGICSPEVASTTDAWHAVGVGAAFNANNSSPVFSYAPLTCASPLIANFINNSANALSYSWSFGDGATSTSVSPSHAYSSAGTYTVTLITTSCIGAKDSSMVVITPGTIHATITFSNSPVTCALPPVTITFTNTSTNASSYNWSFGDGGTSTATSPTHTYTASAKDTVRLVAVSCTGAIDTTIKIFDIGAIPTIATIAEGFEINPLPNNDWNISSAGMNWFVTSSAAATGVKSAMLDNYLNTAGNNSILETISHDLSGYTTPKLTFKVAYQQQQSTNNDKLQILSSIDCGNSWQPRWTRAGSILATVTPPSTTPFVPTPAQFTTYTVNINALTGQPNVRFRFEFFGYANGLGNNVYLDDINLFDASVGIENFDTPSQLDIYPNPASSNVTLAFNFTKKHEVSVTVTDLLGRNIETLVSKQYAAGEVKLNIAEKITYQPGMYIVSINVDGKIISRKITIE